MPNENEMLEEASNGEEMDAIAALAEMRENYVPKSAYDQLKAEKSQILKAVLKGESIPGGEKKEVIDVDKLRKELFGSDAEDLSNIDYVEKALKLRKGVIERGGRDPFLPTGDKVDVTSEMTQTAQRVADVLEECVERAQGDSGVFTAELQRRMMDTGIYKRR